MIVPSPAWERERVRVPRWFDVRHGAELLMRVYELTPVPVSARICVV